MNGKNGDVTAQFDQLAGKLKHEPYVLRLFVAGMTPRSAKAIARVRHFCELYLKGRYELEIIDIYQQPQLTKEHQIVALPTLVKVAPLPMRRLVGDFTDEARVMHGLDVRITS